MSNLISLLSAVVHLLETMIGGGDGHARPGRHSTRTARGDERRGKRRTGHGRARPTDVATLGLVAIAAIAILAIVTAIAIAAGRIGPVPDHATHTPVAAARRSLPPPAAEVEPNCGTDERGPTRRKRAGRRYEAGMAVLDGDAM
jgi:hypothetical protein